MKVKSDIEIAREATKLPIKEIAKKVTEEAGETSISAVSNDGRVIDESADLVFHLLVLLNASGFKMRDVMNELIKRSSN